MVNTTIKYIVYNHAGTGVRHHHFSIQNNIIDEADGTAVSGDHFTAFGLPFMFFNGVNLPFAFMSVKGNTDDNHLYTSPGNRDVTVGSNNIDILVVYGPVGGIGGPGGGPGIWVDAFNVDTGNFSDDLHFIQILTPPTPPDTVDNPKTTEANQEGDVSSLSPEHIRASGTVDGGIPFLEWKKIIPSETILATNDFNLVQNESGEIWFAFYQTQPVNIDIPNLKDRLAQSMGRWVVDDYCGSTGPIHIGPHGPTPFRIRVPKENLAKLTPAQKEKLDSISKAYPETALAAYNAMTKVTTALQGVSDILSNVKRK
jgi:hypothetical protein